MLHHIEARGGQCLPDLYGTAEGGVVGELCRVGDVNRLLIDAGDVRRLHRRTDVLVECGKVVASVLLLSGPHDRVVHQIVTQCHQRDGNCRHLGHDYRQNRLGGQPRASIGRRVNQRAASADQERRRKQEEKRVSDVDSASFFTEIFASAAHGHPSLPGHFIVFFALCQRDFDPIHLRRRSIIRHPHRPGPAEIRSPRESAGDSSARLFSF